MPKVRKSRKPPPDGWELIEPTLDELDQKMREGTGFSEGYLLSDNTRFSCPHSNGERFVDLNRHWNLFLYTSALQKLDSNGKRLVFFQVPTDEL